MTRYIGVDLHTNSFTACLLQAGAEEQIQTLPLQGGGLDQFIQSLTRNGALRSPSPSA